MFVTPAKAGSRRRPDEGREPLGHIWIPASAGMTDLGPQRY